MQAKIMNATSATASDPTKEVTQLANQLKKAFYQLPFVGRKEVLESILRTLITKEHAVLVGPPGTAKSQIVYYSTKLLMEKASPGEDKAKLVKFFSLLLTKFSKPTEIFGTIDVKTLKETGLQRYLTMNKLPEARIAFIDEIFKANSAILNALLRILNEREFENGTEVVKVPIWSVFAASNELPEGEELDALYDRFLYRVFVESLEEGEWNKLLDMWNLEFDVSGSVDFKIIEELNKHIKTTDFSPLNKDYLSVLKALKDHNIHVSDRRKIKCVKAIIADALLNNGGKVSKKNLMVLKYTIPKNKEEYQVVEKILIESVGKVEKVAMQCKEIIPQITDLIAKIEQSKGSSAYNEILKVSTKVDGLRKQIATMKQELGSDADDVLAEVIEKMNEFNTKLVSSLNVK